MAGPSFALLQNYRTYPSTVFYAFDLLRHKGKSTLSLPLSRRRKLLEPIVNEMDNRVRFSHSFEAGVDLINAVREMGLEGVVAKLKDSTYEPGKQSAAWLKYKVNLSQEFVIGGFTPGNPFDAIIVGHYEAGKLVFVAKTRAGFVPYQRMKVFDRFRGLVIQKCPFVNLPEKRGRFPGALTAQEMKKCTWLKPELVAQIEFVSWTRDKKLRHSKFVALREDKKAAEVTAA